MSDTLTHAQLEEVGFSRELMLNGAAVSRSGRLFASFPRWLGAQTIGVGEVGPDGEFAPYPGNHWNDPTGEIDDLRFVTVHSIHIDRADRLWVVDEGPSPFEDDDSVTARPKLIQFDLTTNQVARSYVLDEVAAPKGCALGHIRADDRYAYVTDPRFGALVVVDLETGNGRRVLEGHSLTAADPSIVPMVDGRPMLVHGKVLVVHVDLLELSLDGKWLYFSALFGPTLHRVPVDVLTDSTLSDARIAASVENVARIPPVSGLIHGPDGSLYLSSLTDRAVLRLRPGAEEPEQLLSDERLDSPNEGSVSQDGYLYIPASQANLMPIFHDGVSKMEPPYRVYRVKLPND